MSIFCEKYKKKIGNKFKKNIKITQKYFRNFLYITYQLLSDKPLMIPCDTPNGIPEGIKTK